MDAMEQAKRPVTALAGPYGHPLHPALVAVPIGAWIASFVFDVASHVVDDPRFLAQGSRWLIAIGVLGALAAASVGFLDFFAIPPRTRAKRAALLHMSLNLGVTAAFAVNYVLRGNDQDGPVGWTPLVLSALSLAALGAAGYLGGELVFRHGVRVVDESTQAAAYQPTTPSSPTVPSSTAAPAPDKESS